MSGPFGSSQWMYNAGGDFYPTTIDNSLRFNGSNSTLTKAVTHNRKTFTISFWTKRSNLGRRMIYGAYNNGANTSVIELDNDQFSFYDFVGSSRLLLYTDFKFRDVSAWYHFVIQVDTTQSTASDRAKLYINGEQITSFNSTVYPAQNTDLIFGSGITHAIGTEGTNTRLIYDGYFADWCVIDGQALDPTSFGEFKSGVWVAKDVSGLTFGAGGYYLKFDGNSNDSSGNGNNWTANNISAHDYVPDSPTNNFATFNPLDRNSTSITTLEGNLRVSANSSQYLSMRGTMSFPQSGKWYMEFRNDKTHVAGQAGGGWGIQSVREIWATNFGNFTTHVGVYQTQGYNSAIYRRVGSDHLYGLGSIPSIAYGNAGDIQQIAFDCDSGKIWFGINNTWMGGSSGAVNASSGDPSTGANPVDTLTADMIAEGIVPMVQFADQTGTKTYRFNAGQDSTFQGARSAGGNADANGYGDFAYAPPSGFLSMCHANMPELAIDPANDDTSEDHFNPVIWSGNSTDGRDIVTGHATDFVWIKSRSNATNHYLFDKLRGVHKQLLTNATSAEATYGTNRMTAFNADGFEVGAFNETNGSGRTFVGWSWEAGGSPVSNTAGSITSSVSANPTAGFSIVSYTGTGSNATIGHGLGVAPSMIIQKNRIDSEPWWVYHSGIGAGGQLRLNGSDAVGSDGGVLWNSTAPTSTVFSVGTNGGTNGPSDACIAYCFADIEGYQKVGKFVGNSSEYPFVNLGFRPAFILFKNQQTGAYWAMHDNTRNPHNVADKYLFANLTNAEATQYSKVDLLSNGFKMRSVNGNVNYDGSTTYYLAIAEQPFKYANAR